MIQCIWKKKWENEHEDFCRYNVIAVNFIVIAVYATSNTIVNIVNGDMFYNVKIEIHLPAATVVHLVSSQKSL